MGIEQGTGSTIYDEEEEPFRWFWYFMLISEDCVYGSKLDDLKDGNLIIFLTTLDRKINGITKQNTAKS